jgi:hypothetical protein
MEHETLALHGNNLRSNVTRMIKSMYVLAGTYGMCKIICTHRKRSERMDTSYAKKIRANRTTTGLGLVSGSFGMPIFSCHLDSYVYEKRLVLIYDIKYQQTTHAKLGLARILLAHYARIEQPRGSVFSWELRDVFFF